MRHPPQKHVNLPPLAQVHPPKLPKLPARLIRTGYLACSRHDCVYKAAQKRLMSPSPRLCAPSLSCKSKEMSQRRHMKPKAKNKILTSCRRGRSIVDSQACGGNSDLCKGQPYGVKFPSSLTDGLCLRGWLCTHGRRKLAGMCHINCHMP